MRRLALMLIAVAVGCGAPIALTEGGRNVLLMKADPPAGCEKVGGVSGDVEGTPENLADRSRAAIRNAAAEKGANYVRIGTLGDYSTILDGTAFKCPPFRPSSS